MTTRFRAPGSSPVRRSGSFQLAQITVDGDNILTQNRDRDLDYLLLLDTDRMLYNFRKAFGQDTKGAEPLGGWESDEILLKGHSTGHYLNALALAYAGNGDPRLKEKMDTIVEGLAELQSLSHGDPAAFVTKGSPEHPEPGLWSTDPSTWGEGYVSAYSPDQFALLEQLTEYPKIWAPYYTLHKILSGLLDAYELAGIDQALEVAEGIGNWVSRRLGAVSDERRKAMWSLYIAGEYGGMNEAMTRLYHRTGDEKYFQTAQLFDNPNIFPQLAAGEDVLQGIHANQHIPQLIGAIEEYQATGDADYYLMALHFWEIVTEHYTYAIGGVGVDERFTAPDGLAAGIKLDRNCETCCAYNMLKLTAMLRNYEPNDSRYMDYYERTLFNQIAASQNPNVTATRHHGVTYMLPVSPGVRKEYTDDYHEFTCCHGTGMENHVKYQSQIYHQANGVLYVDLYVPSTLEGKLRMEGEFPGEEMRLTSLSEHTQTVRLRIPSWCRDFAVEGVKGRSVGGGYLQISLKAGESAVIQLPYTLRFEDTPDEVDGHPLTAVLYGPLVMVALDERTEYLTFDEGAFEVGWDEGAPVMWNDGVMFVPMYQAHDTAYHTYMVMK